MALIILVFANILIYRRFAVNGDVLFTRVLEQQKEEFT